jgi:hypothetical protein
MRAISLGAVATLLALSLSCGSDDKALRNATEDDLPQLALQEDDVDTSSGQAGKPCDRTGTRAEYPLGRAVKSYSVEFDLTGSQSGQLSCLLSEVGMYGSPDEALSDLRSFDALFFEGERVALGGTDLSAERIETPDLGEYSSGFVVECPSCSELKSRTYVVQMQRANVRSLILVSAGQREGAIREVIEYAEKQVERIETVLRAND